VIRYQITDGTANIAAVRSDVEFVQIREPQLPPRRLAEFVRAAMAGGSKVLVNDRVDVALACGARGAHLKSGSASPHDFRKITPPGFVITFACHGEEDLELAQGADFLLVSPVFRPLSKQDTRPALGIEGLKRMMARSSIPVLALGGITEDNSGRCLAAGATGVAGISLFLPTQTVR
jgi:thiamine-phosphate pyrophosphorylase